MEHTRILGLDISLVELAVAALVCGALFFYIGVLNPAKENENKWRQWWTYADVLAVVLTIIGVVKIMSPLISAEQMQANATTRNIATGKRENILYALNRVQDDLCPVAGLSEENVTTCGVIRTMQRSLYMPSANFVTAKVILDQDLPKICRGAACSASFQEIRRQLLEFRTYYLDNRQAIDEVPATTERDVAYTMLFIGFYMLVGSFRLGRSGAEFERNRLARKEAEDKAKRAGSNAGPGDVYRRLAQIEEMIATLTSDSDTFKHRHAGLTVVGQSGSQRDVWRSELARLSGTAKGPVDRTTIRAAITALLARARTTFRVAKRPFEGRWKGADPVAESVYGELAIRRSTMSWGGQGRSRVRRVGKFALQEDAADTMNGTQPTYRLDVRVAGRGHERDRLKLSFPLAGNADDMDMIEYREGKPVRRMRFRRLQ